VLVLASFALFTCVFVVCALFGWLLRKNISKRKMVRMSATAKVIAYSCFTPSHPIWRLSVVGVMVGPQTATRPEIFQQNGIGIPSVNSINSTVIVLYSISRTTNLDSAQQVHFQIHARPLFTKSTWQSTHRASFGIHISSCLSKPRPSFFLSFQESDFESLSIPV